MELLIVDDEIAIIKSLIRALDDYPFNITYTDDASQGLVLLKENHFDILITDQRMPKVSGLELIKYIRDHRLNTLPIMMTGYSDFSVLIDAINSGHVYRYLPKPWKPEELYKIINEARDKKIADDNERKIISQYYVEKNQWLNTAMALTEGIDTQKRTIINGFTQIIKAKDKDLFHHSNRVAKTSVGLAKFIGLSESKCKIIWDAAMVHDIGKIAIMDQIVFKKGLLEEDEFVEMRRHAELGEEILTEVAGLEGVAVIVGQHHEKADGSGYPRGLMLSDICIEAQIISIVDVYDALLNKRPYKGAMSQEEVMDRISEMREKHFADSLVKSFIEYHNLSGFKENLYEEL